MSPTQIIKESVDIYNNLEFKESNTPNLERIKKVEKHLISSQISLLQAELERKKGMIRKEQKYHCITEECATCGWNEGNDFGYNQAIQEDVDYLQEQINEAKKLI